MVIGDRLKQLRESKKLSQGDIEKRTGLLRCYISRVENGHTVPAVETLEKMARALEVPMYQLFSCGGYLRRWSLTGEISCCIWRKRWRDTTSVKFSSKGKLPNLLVSWELRSPPPHAALTAELWRASITPREPSYGSTIAVDRP